MFSFSRYLKLGLAVIVISSLAANAYMNLKIASLEKSLAIQASESARLLEQRDRVIETSQAQSAQITQLQAQQIESQKRTDELQQQLAASDAKRNRAIAQLREAIKNENCANEPVPAHINWLYDNTRAGGD